jgi:hypothetical protein
MHSTGFVDGDRYTVALIIEGPTSLYSGGGSQTLSAMARALLPSGVIPQPPPPTPDPSPSDSSPAPTDTPSPTDSPSPTEGTPTSSPTESTPTESG